MIAQPPDAGRTETVQVFDPVNRRLPPLGRYARQFWRRRALALELARSEMRAEHLNSVLGQLWLLINPLLLASVYFILVEIVAGGGKDATYFAHLLAALFAFQLVSNSVSAGAKSVTGGGRLVQNVVFPRLLLPASSVVTALLKLLPALLIYAVLHVAVGRPVGPSLLWLVPVLGLLLLFSFGMASLVAMLQVHFRDIKTLLPFCLRIWLYLSPVLYAADDVPAGLQPFIRLNPLYPMLAGWQDALSGQAPEVGDLLASAAWAAAALLIGLGTFLILERDIASRL